MKKRTKKWRKKRAALFFVLLLVLAGSPSWFGQSTVIEVSAESTTDEVDAVLKSVRDYIKKNDTNPDYNSIWNVVGLKRSGLDVPQNYYDTFYTNIVKYMKDNSWNLTTNKYSEYSKVIVALTAIGKDARQIEGHNLLADLADFSNVKKQGINGPIWALIAVNTHPSYTIPTVSGVKEQTTEEGIIRYLLDREIEAGGWALKGSVPDSDITGMAIQALAPYYGKKEDVTGAIDRALTRLSEMQENSGAYGTMGGETSESTSHIITALSSIGVDCDVDSRFIKNGNSPIDGLLQYYLPEGGFMHVLPGAESNGGAEAGVLDGMATEQGLYSLAAYKRMKSGKTALYDMSDVTLTGSGAASDTPTTGTGEKGDSTGGTTGDTTTSLSVKVKTIAVDYSSITLTKGKTKALKATVSPSNASNTAVTWSSSNKKVATVTQTGTVKGVAKGTATITVKAKDGSGVKATCKVQVNNPVSFVGNGSNTNVSGGTATKTAGTAVTKKVGTATTKSLGTDASASEEASTEEGGWSFSGEDYMPESYEDGVADVGTAEDVVAETTEAEGTHWSDKAITIRIPLGGIFYAGVGGVSVIGIEALIWWIRKKRKGRKIAE